MELKWAKPEYQNFLIVRQGDCTQPWNSWKSLASMSNPQDYRKHVLKETCWVHKLQKRWWRESRMTKELTRSLFRQCGGTSSPVAELHACTFIEIANFCSIFLFCNSSGPWRLISVNRYGFQMQGFSWLCVFEVFCMQSFLCVEFSLMSITFANATTEVATF